MTADIERVARAVRAAQKAYMHSPDSDRALNNFDYERVGIEAAMRETRRIDAEAMRYSCGLWEGPKTGERCADWLKGRADEDA